MLTHDDVHEGPAGAGPSVDVPAQPGGPLRLGPVFARSPVAMGVVDAGGRLLAVNQSLADYLGRSPEALVGTTLHAHASADDVGRLRTGTSERRLRHARGHDLWAVVSSVPMPEAGDGATLVCLDDATSRRNTERMLLHAALHDSLTNLPNRRLLRDRLDDRAEPGPAVDRAGGGAVRRPGPVQGRQRHVRPRRGRRGAGVGGQGHPQRAAVEGHGGPAGRRRVRGHRRGAGRRRGPGPAGRAAGRRHQPAGAGARARGVGLGQHRGGDRLAGRRHRRRAAAAGRPGDAAGQAAPGAGLRGGRRVGGRRAER